MSIQATRWAYALPKSISPVAVSIAAALADCHNGKTGKCCPSINTLARMTHWSRPTILKALGELEVAGVIAIDKGNRRRSNAYRLLRVVNDVDHPATSVVNHATTVVNDVYPNRKEPERNRNSVAKATEPPGGGSDCLEKISVPKPESPQAAECQQAASKLVTDHPNDSRQWVETTFAQAVAAATTFSELWIINNAEVVCRRANAYGKSRPELQEQMRELYWRRHGELGITRLMWSTAKANGWNPESLTGIILNDLGQPQTDDEYKVFKSRWFSMAHGDSDGLNMLKDRG